MPATKTTVYLDEAEYRKLQRLAKRQQRPAAELIREAVSEYAAREAPRALPKSLGAGASGRGDLSERSEELLVGFGRRR